MVLTLKAAAAKIVVVTAPVMPVTAAQVHGALAASPLRSEHSAYADLFNPKPSPQMGRLGLREMKAAGAGWDPMVPRNPGLSAQAWGCRVQQSPWRVLPALAEPTRGHVAPHF